MNNGINLLLVQDFAHPQYSKSTKRLLKTHFLSGWPKKRLNFMITTKVAFAKSIKSRNSGSEKKKQQGQGEDQAKSTQSAPERFSRGMGTPKSVGFRKRCPKQFNPKMGTEPQTNRNAGAHTNGVRRVLKMGIGPSEGRCPFCVFVSLNANRRGGPAFLRILGWSKSGTPLREGDLAHWVRLSRCAS